MAGRDERRLVVSLDREEGEEPRGKGGAAVTAGRDGTELRERAAAAGAAAATAAPVTAGRDGGRRIASLDREDGTELRERAAAAGAAAATAAPVTRGRDGQRIKASLDREDSADLREKSAPAAAAAAAAAADEAEGRWASEEGAEAISHARPGAGEGPDVMNSMGRTASIGSVRSIMGGVQRRIKLIEGVDGQSSKSPFTSEASSAPGIKVIQRRATGLTCLIMMLVSFVALCSGGAILILLEVHLDREGPLTKEDMESLRVTCLAVFGAAMAASLFAGLLVSLCLTRPLHNAVALMECTDRSACKQGMKALAKNKTRIADIGDVQEASLQLLESIEVFKRYLPETVVRDIVRGDARARRLHVERRNVTIMFSDLQDFTTISEKLSHHNLLFLLTRYLSIMTRIIDAYEGVVAEILGDGLLVFWNTPDDVCLHAAKACAAALAQCEALESLNSEFESMGLPQLFIRVGIHTGTVLTGNIGSESKMKFGCMGDPVNLASRLEGLCKNYGVNVLCSAATHAELPEDNCFCTRQLDLVQVKGKNEATRIYEVMALDTDIRGEDGGSPSNVAQEGRHMRSFCAVAKEAISDSAEALGDTDVARNNSFVRMIRNTRKRWSICSAVAENSSPTSMGTRSSEPGYMGGRASELGSMAGRSSERVTAEEAGVNAQGSFSDFARSVSVTYTSSHGHTRASTPQTRAFAASYEKALLHYQQARFAEARAAAQKLLVDSPRDRAAQVLLERASRYLGPSNEIVGLTDEEIKAWTGITRMTEK